MKKNRYVIYADNEIWKSVSLLAIKCYNGNESQALREILKSWKEFKDNERIQKMY